MALVTQFRSYKRPSGKDYIVNIKDLIEINSWCLEVNQSGFGAKFIIFGQPLL